MLLQFGPAGGEGVELVLGAGAELGDLAHLPAYAVERARLAVERPVLVGGAGEVLVRVGGEGQPDGGVDAAATVLGGGVGTEGVTRGVEAFGPAGGLVAQRVEDFSAAAAFSLVPLYFSVAISASSYSRSTLALTCAGVSWGSACAAPSKAVAVAAPARAREAAVRAAGPVNRRCLGLR